MVKMSTAVLPGPPSTSAQVWKIMKPETWAKPMAMVWRGATSFSERPLSLTAMINARAAPTQRSAAKAKGGA